MDRPLNKLTYKQKALAVFLLMFIAFLATATILGIQINQNRDNNKKLRSAIVQLKETRVTIAALQKEQIDSCENFNTLKDAVNKFHGYLKGFLITARNARLKTARLTHDPKIKQTNEQTAKEYERILESLIVVKARCAQNP